jgi:hypothetical protein
MSRISCRLLAALVAVAALSAMGASAASATTWHTNKGVGGYSGAFTAAAGAFTLTGDWGVGTCTGSTYAGAEGGPSFVGNPWSGAFTGRITGTGCVFGGPARLTCDVTMTGASYSGPAASPALSAVSIGTAGVGCSVVRLGFEVCRITGTAVPFTYTNPSTAGGADGRFMIPAFARTSGVLTIADGTGGMCSLGTGTAALTAIAYFMTSVPQPIMWRTNP